MLSSPDALSFARCLLLVVQLEEPPPSLLITHRTEGSALLLPPSEPQTGCSGRAPHSRYSRLKAQLHHKLLEQGGRFTAFQLLCVNCLRVRSSHRTVSHPSRHESARARSYPAVPRTL